MKYELVVYTMESCGYCTDFKKLLEEANIPFHDRDIHKNEKEFDQALFIPNTGVIFKSNIPHAGLEPTRHFTYVRMTVAFKLTEIMKD